MNRNAHVDPQELPDDEFLAKAAAMCATKAAYTTRPEAVAFTRRRGFSGSPYRCPWCAHWHLTSYDRARAKAFTRRLSRLSRAAGDPTEHQARLYTGLVADAAPEEA